MLSLEPLPLLAQASQVLLKTRLLFVQGSVPHLEAAVVVGQGEEGPGGIEGDAGEMGRALVDADVAGVDVRGDEVVVILAERGVAGGADSDGRAEANRGAA